MTFRKRINLAWSDEEKNVLHKMWIDPDIKIDDLKKVFHYRSWHSIDSYARKQLGLDRFTQYRREKMNLDHLKEIGKVYDLE